MIKKQWQNKNMKESFLSAVDGIKIAIKTEKNAKRIFIIGVLMLLLSLICNISSVEFMLVILVIVGVFLCEIFNTLVENILDMIQPETDPKIRVLKHISSAAVLIASAGAALVGAIIFLPKIYNKII